ncbi:hypothetical protein CXB51_033590 [Gossypium anomalum]|uniref:Uncharacterized protein n=1 Tax=Gossypium anomalum TaxID=47600 RepID=A0A8J5YNZ5_9ROSI|nr:hypothetical protein CXB51_033590 [Gossypium anomalum]
MAVRAWSEKLQLEKGDSLAEGYTSELQNFTRINVTQNELQEVKDIWTRWDEGTKQLFYQSYGDILYLLDVKVDKRLFQDLILTHPDEKKRVDIFALSIYGLVIFPKALRYVDEAVTDLFDRLEKGVTPKVNKVSYWVFSEGYSPLKEEMAMQRRDDISEEKWMEILQNLKEDNVKWRAFLMVPDEILQYKSRQFIPTTYGMAQCEFPYKGDHYRKKVRELSDAWRQIHWMKRLTVGSTVTPEYNGWFRKRVNDNIPRPSLKSARPMEEQLQVVPSELEIIKQDFEKKSSEFRKKIEQLEEEKMHLKLECQEVREERAKANQWEKRYQEAQARNEALERSLSESKNEKDELRARVVELERSLCLYRNRNSVTELKVRSRDYIMGEAVTQIREVADYLQSLAVQVDILSVKYS